MIAFHVTLGRSVPNILARGIQPRLGRRAKELGEVERAVHLYRTKKDCKDGLAGWFKDVFVESEIADLVVLEVTITKDMPVWKERDDELRALDLIAPSCIKKVWDSGMEEDLSERFEPATLREAEHSEVGDNTANAVDHE